MIAALQAAVECFEHPIENPRAVVYVGDGVSRIKAFGDAEVRDLVVKLVARRASVSSFAIGPGPERRFPGGDGESNRRHGVYRHG